MKTWMFRGSSLLLGILLLWGISSFTYTRGREGAEKEFRDFLAQMAAAPEPERCALCESGGPFHAPCLLNPSTGGLLEFAIYDPHPEQAGEIAQTLEDGVLKHYSAPGLSIRADPDSQTAWAFLPEELPPMEPGLFCHSCRLLLAGTSTRGCILLDLYQMENIRAYPTDPGETYSFRGYTTTIAERGAGEALIQVSAHLIP